MQKTLVLIFLFIPLLLLNAQIENDTLKADDFRKKAEVLLTNGKLDSARVLINEATRIYFNSKLWVKHFTCEFRIVSIDVREKKFAEALGKLKSIKESSILNLGKDNFAEAQCYFTNGNIYLQTQKYKDAVVDYNLALTIQVNLTGENSNDVGDTYNNIGNSNFYLSDFNSAVEFWKKSLKIRIVNNGISSKKVSDSYNNIAYAFQILAKYDSSLVYYAKSIEIRKKLFGENHAILGDSYINLGIVFYEMSDFNKALEYYSKSLSIRKIVLGENHALVADCYNNIGNVYYSTAQIDLALEYFYKSLEIRKTVLGNNHSLVAESYDNIGNVYSEKKEYSKSLQNHLLSSEIFKNILGDRNIKVAYNYNNLGLDYKNIGDYEKSLQYFTESLSIYRELFGDKHVRVAESYNNIAYLYYIQNNYDVSLKNDRMALDIQKELLGENNSKIIVSYIGIADALNAKKEYTEALKYYDLAIAVNFRLVEKKYYDLKENLTSVVNYKDLLKSLKSKGQAILSLIESKQTNPNNYKLNDALQVYILGDKLLNAIRHNLISIKDKYSLGELAAGFYENGIELCFKIIKNNLDDGSIKELAFRFSEQSKSTILYSLIMHSKAIRYSNLPDSLLNKEKELSALKATYLRQIEASTDSSELIRLQKVLFETNRKYEKHLQLIKSNNKQYFDLVYDTETVNLKELQEHLDKNTSVLSYFLGTKSIFLFLVKKNKLDIKSILFDSTLAKSIISYVQALKMGENDSFKKESANLFAKLIKPVFLNIESYNSMIIAADGLLSKIPFEALIVSAPKRNKIEYLNNRFIISYVPSLTIFSKSLSGNKTKPANKDLSFAGIAPVFSSQMLGLPNENNYRNMDSIMRSSMLNSSNKLQELPYSKEEVKNAYALFHGKKKLLVNKEATEIAFKKLLEVDSYNIVHLSTHGFSNEEKPELSCLAFSSYKDSSNYEDDFLFAGETYNLKMNDVDLLVLSSCESGIGKVEKGEGMLSLTRGFIYSGAKKILQSLWKINDKYTSHFMDIFYNYFVIKNYNVKRALQKTKNEMIKKGVFPGLWSAFVLTEN